MSNAGVVVKDSTIVVRNDRSAANAGLKLIDHVVENEHASIKHAMEMMVIRRQMFWVQHTDDRLA